ncbi:Methyltransferase domain-containing protein [Nitrosomonas ureae]|uniref:Methyltransferase domain-containing protein n=1 Tax=Nitrosomonas ureae TaxID=44577 RepID=A0A285BXQ5_9PROT|nr:class I SAM-dependent methyltransferase [Nitrosomonas ureae]SNX60009.1 Methyltransferase domain-containing protein [Nitrosomonas ureae]
MRQTLIGAEANPDCYLCGKPGEILYRNRADYLFGTPGEWSFKVCSGDDCGLVWLDPRPMVSEIGKAYQNYYTHEESDHMRQTPVVTIMRAVLHSMSTHLLGLRKERRRYKCMYLDQISPGRLLEVGCGNGKRLARMQALGWDVMGQEVDPVAASYVSEKRGIPVHLGMLQALDVTKRYDAVILSHVIEHVHDPLSLLESCYRLLKKNGLLVILTPNIASYGHQKFGAGWRGLEPPRHLYLFNRKTLSWCAQKAGFSSLHSWTTSVGAFGIGQASLSCVSSIKEGHHFITTRDVWRGFWFQLAARIILLFNKDSGEECVLMATRK